MQVTSPYSRREPVPAHNDFAFTVMRYSLIRAL